MATKKHNLDNHKNINNLPSLFHEISHNKKLDPEQQAIHFYALSMIKGIGPIFLKKLCRIFPDLSEVWEFNTKSLVNILKNEKIKSSDIISEKIKNNKNDLLSKSIRNLNQMKENSTYIIMDCHPLFPESLKCIPDRPFWLFVQGDPKLLIKECNIAVVGTRKPSQSGINATQYITKELVQRGFTIVSGLADGIDSIAHKTVLRYGGKTIAILGHGLNIDFPASNRDLRYNIYTSNGAIITEHFPYTMYSAANFVKRNRIIAALSNIVIPIESKAESGTAHTIRFAEDYGKTLIGIILDEINNSNEIPYLLKQKGYSIINISKPDGPNELWSIIKKYATDAEPIKLDENALRLEAYKEALDTILKAHKIFPMDEACYKWFIEKVRNTIRGKTNGD